MTALQVRDCPTDIYENLRAEANEENRSISQQMLTILQERYASRRTRESGETFAAGGFESKAERAARKQRILSELSELPAFEIPPEYGDAATLVSSAREERW